MIDRPRQAGWGLPGSRPRLAHCHIDMPARGPLRHAKGPSRRVQRPGVEPFNLHRRGAVGPPRSGFVLRLCIRKADGAGVRPRSPRPCGYKILQKREFSYQVSQLHQPSPTARQLLVIFAKKSRARGRSLGFFGQGGLGLDFGDQGLESSRDRSGSRSGSIEIQARSRYPPSTACRSASMA